MSTPSNPYGVRRSETAHGIVKALLVACAAIAIFALLRPNL